MWESVGVPTLGIIESRPIIRSGIISLLAGLGGIQLNGAVLSLNELPQLGEPDLLVLGMDLPGASPSHTVALLKRRLPRARVFGIPSTAAAERRHRALDLLAGWISVSSSSSEIARVLGICDEPQRASRPSAIWHAARVHITHREHEVLDLIARAYSNRHVALELGIAEGTVKRHLTNLFEKFGATSRMQLVSIARNQDLVA